ncbi:Crp/Fnr family transcriptional regulator [Chitinophaga qingshengii]|uniref:Crp/Fnr family transcriptional regulator n=1 Tax=Chitinophaga qingshengii TaxID=1569794 RepID=A0ABR7TW47_9BACT|nr:Crp/Fnr family transcriptional regulator [Chitinophaga qingshengii]MBC9934711.1 Crp/Fnr family transcriptional regulator [Chitinophaga qingshengii]
MSKGIFPIDQWDFSSESVLADLPQEVYDRLTAHQRKRTYAPQEILFREGAFPAGIFYIVSGKVKKFKADKEGREQIVNLARTGELVGYHALLSEERYPDTAAALEESTIAFIPKDDFLAALDHSPILTNRLLTTLSHEYAVLVNNLTMFAQKTVRERLALQLLIVREKFKIKGEDAINLNREDLANLVGTARENVIRALAVFRDEGLVETRGRKIIIRDVDKLMAIASYT